MKLPMKIKMSRREMMAYDLGCCITEAKNRRIRANLEVNRKMKRAWANAARVYAEYARTAYARLKSAGEDLNASSD